MKRAASNSLFIRAIVQQGLFITNDSLSGLEKKIKKLDIPQISQFQQGHSQLNTIINNIKLIKKKITPTQTEKYKKLFELADKIEQAISLPKVLKKESKSLTLKVQSEVSSSLQGQVEHPLLTPPTVLTTIVASSSAYPGVSISSEQVSPLSFIQQTFRLQMTTLTSTPPTNDLEVDQRVEHFLMKYQGPIEKLFDKFKEAYALDKWSATLRTPEKVKSLILGFTYYETFIKEDIAKDSEKFQRAVAFVDSFEQWSQDIFNSFFDEIRTRFPRGEKLPEGKVSTGFKSKIAQELIDVFYKDNVSYQKFKEVLIEEDYSTTFLIASEQFVSRRLAKSELLKSSLRVVLNDLDITPAEKYYEEDDIYEYEFPFEFLEGCLNRTGNVLLQSLKSIEPNPLELQEIQQKIDVWILSPIRPRQIIEFFYMPQHRNMRVIAYFMEKMDWSKIEPESSEISLSNELSIFFYTMNYAVNSFLREKFWELDLSNVSQYKGKFANDYVEDVWNIFRKNPVATSINWITQTAELIASLVLAPPANFHFEQVYRSINFQSQVALEKALLTYLPPTTDLKKMKMKDMVFFEKELTVKIREEAFSSTSTDPEVVAQREGEGISFGGEYMITFIFSGAVDRGTFIDDFTNRGQSEVLFKIGLEYDVIALERFAENAYYLYCEIKEKLKEEEY